MIRKVSVLSQVYASLFALSSILSYSVMSKPINVKLSKALVKSLSRQSTNAEGELNITKQPEVQIDHDSH